MAGLDVASGIAGLMALTIKVSGALTEYVTAVRDKSKNIQELRDELGLLGEALSLLNDFIVDEELKGRNLDDSSVFTKAIKDCKDRIERIGDKLQPPQGNKFGRAWDRFTWPFEQKEVVKLVESLRRFTHIFHFAANTQGFRMVSKGGEEALKSLQEIQIKLNALSLDNANKGLAVEGVKKKIQRVDEVIRSIPVLEATASEVREISQSVRVAEQEAMKQRRTRVLDWLCPKEVLHRHSAIQEQRMAGTGQRFLQQASFTQWSQAVSVQQDLVCIAGPGAGKSFISSIIIDHLSMLHKRNDIAIAYFYFDYKEAQSQNAAVFAACLLRQLCRLSTSLPAAVSEFYERTRDDMKDQTWFQDLCKVLQRVKATFTSCFFVIDALDEIEAGKCRESVFELLDLLRGAQGVTKVFATTRPHLSKVEENFEQAVKLGLRADSGDIRAHLGKLIDRSQAASAFMNSSLKEDILNQLCETADGMFLLPALQISGLLSHVTKAGVRKALIRLKLSATDPTAKRLDEVFASTIDRIQHQDSELKRVALDTLMWISCARRPLKADELQHALAVEMDDSDLDIENTVPLSTIVDSCCGLVEVEQATSFIRFPHFALQEYLGDQEQKLFGDSNQQILRTLLKYISFDSVKHLAAKSRAGFLGALQNFPLLDYACTEWGHHARSVRLNGYQDLVLPLLDSMQALLTIARVRDRKSPFLREYRKRMEAWAFSGGGGISLAANFNLTDLVQLLIRRMAVPILDARNVHGSTPLHEAARLGHIETAEVLVNHGANLLDTNLGGSTPLYLAVAANQLQLAEFLIKFDGAQLNKASRAGSTPLHCAATLGYENMVSLLLRLGASPRVVNDRGLTPLHLAARYGYLGISRSLIETPSEVDIRAFDHLTPLDFATAGGNLEIVQLLLKNGATVNSTGWDKWTPLHRAARGGHAETVYCLLERGAWLMISDSKGNIPLLLAVRSGRLDVVSMLLNSRLDLRQQQVFHKDKKGSTPRDIAFYCAHYHIHKYLRSVEREYTPVESSSADELTLVIESGDVHRLRSLIQQHPSAVDRPDEDGQPPLHVAIQESQLPIAKVLLDLGAKIESTGYHGWRPLHIAASLGNLALVNLCLAQNASVHSRTNSQQTPLHKACSSKNVDVVRRLLEAGAKARARNDRGMNALHVAAHQNGMDVVRLLVVDYGVSVFEADGFGNTALMWADKSGHLECSAFLKEVERVQKRWMRGLGIVKSTASLGVEEQREVEPEDEEEDVEVLEHAAQLFA